MHFKNKMVFGFIILILLASIFLSGCVEKNTTGSAYFSSVPAGANIWIEGANTGYLTPATIQDIGEGNYTYSLMKEGYFDFNSTFNVELGEVTDLPQALLNKTGSEVSIYELKYYLLENVGTLFYCDPDFYPVAHEGGEQQNALEQFFEIQNNTEEYQAILRHTNMQTIHDPSSEQKLLIYREHKKLNAIILSPSQDTFEFQLLISEDGNNIFDIQGTIDQNRSLTILKNESTFYPCPICLEGNTGIDTPNGTVAVKDIQKGMTVWTADASGNRVPAIVLMTVSVPTTPDYRIVHLVLDDGRELFASPGHPVADGRILASLMPGDDLDGAKVLTIQHIPDKVLTTYDILPAGDTGSYWANNIALKSTLKN